MFRNHNELLDFGEVEISLLNRILFDIDVDNSLCRTAKFHFNINQ